MWGNFVWTSCVAPIGRNAFINLRYFVCAMPESFLGATLDFQASTIAECEMLTWFDSSMCMTLT